jgi:hypothetical protein
MIDAIKGAIYVILLFVAVYGIIFLCVLASETGG